MVEVPALLYQLDELLKKVDFVRSDPTTVPVSCSRSTGNEGLERFDPCRPDPAGLHEIVQKAMRREIRSLCGEMASKPIGALRVIALGYRSLSLSATAQRRSRR